MSKLVYMVQCEWDIGQEYVAFSNEAFAEDWILASTALKDLYNSEKEFNNFDISYEDYIDSLYDEGLINIVGIDLI